MTIIVVLNKENLATLLNTDDSFVALHQASIIQINHSQQDIASVVRSGSQLIIRLNNGEKIILEGFFQKDGTTVHELVLPDASGQLQQVEFDAKGKVIDYNPLTSLNELATSQTMMAEPVILQADAPVEKAVWYQQAWVKPALIALGIEAVYLTAFDNDEKESAPQDRTPPATPTASLNAEGKIITGKTEAKAKVYVQDVQGHIIGEAVADANGQYTVELKREVINGERVGVYAKDAAGNASTMLAVTGTKDTIAPDAPAAQFNDAGSIVSGRAEAGSKVSLYSADGKTLLAGPVTAASDGSFSLTLNPALAPNAQAQVIAQDTAGNSSVPTQVVVGQDTLAPHIPQIQVNSTGSQVKGYSEANSTIEIQNPQGQIIATATADAKGYFELSLNPTVTANSQITLVVKDAAGNSSKAIVLKPELDTLPPDAVNASVNAEGTVVTGTAEPNAQIKISMVSNGQSVTIGSGQADAEGKFSIALQQSLINNATANVYAIDKAGNLSTAVAVIGSKDTLAPNKINLSNFVLRDDMGEDTGIIQQNGQTDDARPSFEGRGEANATLTIYDQGIALTTVKVKADGTWTYTPDTDLALGTHQFSFTQMDKSGNTSAMSDVFKLTVIAAPLEIEQSDIDTVNLAFDTDVTSANFYSTQTLVLPQDEAETVEPILAALFGEAEEMSKSDTLHQPIIIMNEWQSDDSLLHIQSYI